MGSGNVEFIEDETGKSHALTRILQHLDKTDAQYNFPSQALSKTCVFGFAQMILQESAVDKGIAVPILDLLTIQAAAVSMPATDFKQ